MQRKQNKDSVQILDICLRKRYQKRKDSQLLEAFNTVFENEGHKTPF